MAAFEGARIISAVVVTGVPNEKLIEVLTNEEQLFPVSFRTIDLIKPVVQDNATISAAVGTGGCAVFSMPVIEFMRFSLTLRAPVP